MLMCARHMKAQGRLNGNALVATVMSNIGLEIALRDAGIELVRCPVGDKYVMEEMIRRGISHRRRAVGPRHFLRPPLHRRRHRHRAQRAAGHGGHGPRAGRPGLGAGVLSAGAGQRPRRARGRTCASVPAIAAAMERVERRLDGQGRLLVRYSGTEPLLRVMIEGKDQQEIQGVGQRDRRHGQATLGMNLEMLEIWRLLRILNRHGSSERQRQQGRDAAQLPRRRAAVRRRRGARLRRTPARRASPCTRAPTSVTSRRDDVTRRSRVSRRDRGATVEFNIEGDPRPDLLDTGARGRGRTSARSCRCRPGEITSQAGWPPDTPAAELGAVVATCSERGIRVSLFVDPDAAAVRWAASLGADRIELYTEPFARAFEQGARPGRRGRSPYVRRRQPGARARPGHQRRARPRPRQSRAVPDAAASRRGLHRPRARSATRCTSASTGPSGTIWRRL